jgi:signal transduction histidine kinase
MRNKLYIRACKNFGAEVASVIKELKLDDVDVDLFRVRCTRPGHLEEESGTDAGAQREDGEPSVVLGGWCVQGHDLSPAKADSHRFHKFDQCFYLVAPKETVDGYLSQGCYMLTPGWLLNWKKTIHDWRFDKATARQFFEESCTRLVLLNTGVIPDCVHRVSEFANFVNRPFEVVPVGLGFLRLRIENIVLQWRSESNLEKLREAERKSADYAMAYELISRMTEIKTETEAIRDVLDLFNMLFAPEKLAYVPVVDFALGQTCSSPATYEVSWPRPNDLSDDAIFLEPEKGFLVRVRHKNETLGMIKVGGVTFPCYLTRYLNLAVAMGKICGLTISNARAYEVIKRTEDNLRLEIVERKKAEEEGRRMGRELLRLEKLEAMSVVAGGIAHDFNNLLGVVLGNIEMAQDELDPQEGTFRDLEAARNGAVRAGELVKKFLALSDAHVPVKHAVNMGNILPRAFQTILNGSRAQNALTVSDDLWCPEVDPSQIYQALCNVLENAREATDQGNAIHVSAQNAEISAKDEMGKSQFMKPGKFVKVSVVDSGLGIPLKNLDKIFDPYFSTKTRGTQKGMGMGLAIAHSIIKKHDGHIHVASIPGEGTCVDIYLPAMKQADSYDG